MAFAAARMIKDKKDQDLKQKRSAECISSAAKERSKLNIRYPWSGWSGSNSSLKSGFSDLSLGKAARNHNSSPGKFPPCRSGVKCVKRVKGRHGKPDRTELIVTLDMAELKLAEEQLAEYREVFQLLDKDQDGVLSFTQLGVALNILGRRISDQKLLKMVRSVSEDRVYNSIEFNEFLMMMSNQEKEEINMECLMEAFKHFDCSGDGVLSMDEMKKILAASNEKMTNKDIVDMVKEAEHEDCMDYKELCSVICPTNGTTNMT